MRRHGEAISRGHYNGSLEDYADYIERYRLGCGAAGAWKAWLRNPSAPRAKRPPRDDAAYYREKYSTRIEFRLRERMRRQFTKWFKGERKSRPSFIRSLTYSFDDLRTHLEAQFQPGMSWANFGAWHIDHVVPKALFDPADEAQVAACWALANLRPLWALDNLRRPKDGSDLAEPERRGPEDERRVNGSFRACNAYHDRQATRFSIDFRRPESMLPLHTRAVVGFQRRRFCVATRGGRESGRWNVFASIFAWQP